MQRHSFSQNGCTRTHVCLPELVYNITSLRQKLSTAHAAHRLMLTPLLQTSNSNSCCITFAESEPYCHSILFVWMSVGHSATYSLPRLIDHNQIWSAGILPVLGPVYTFLDPLSPIHWVPEGKICKISPISNVYSCYCERDASCHMTCLHFSHSSVIDSCLIVRLSNIIHVTVSLLLAITCMHQRPTSLSQINVHFLLSCTTVVFCQHINRWKQQQYASME